MPVLPILRGRQVVQVFEAFGWRIARQRGSHIILVNPNYNGDAFRTRPQGRREGNTAQLDSGRRTYG